MPDRDNARVWIIRAGNGNKESLKYYTYRQNTKCVPDYCRDAGVLLPAKMIPSIPAVAGWKVHKERAYLVSSRICRDVKVLPSHRHGPAGHGGTTGVPEAGERAGYTASVPVGAGND